MFNNFFPKAQYIYIYIFSSCLYVRKSQTTPNQPKKQQP